MKYILFEGCTFSLVVNINISKLNIMLNDKSVAIIDMNDKVHYFTPLQLLNHIKF